MDNTNSVMPAQAGIQPNKYWVPAFAGTTKFMEVSQ
jgi:hypothetical protein